MATKSSGWCVMSEAYRAGRTWKAPGLERAGLGKHCGIGFARAMRRIVLANETDWEGWRKATRSLVMAGAAPDDVRWSVRSHDEEGDPLHDGSGSFGVSRALVS